MSNMAFHRCQCGYETDVSNGNSVFDSEIHCRQCGLSASESDAKVSLDLSSLMAGFNIDTMPSQSHDVSMPPTPQAMPQHAPITYITQHYTHSAHVTLPQHSATPVADALAAVGVDSSALLPSQIQLFRNAQPDQQARLIELWRIAPPTAGNQLLAKHLGNWPSTSMEREEEAARARWERTEQEKVKNLCTPHTFAEPYVVNGYGQNVNSEKAHTAEHSAQTGRVWEREWWRLSENQPIEHQYGMLQESQLHGFHLDSQDEEML